MNVYKCVLTGSQWNWRRIYVSVAPASIQDKFRHVCFKATSQTQWHTTCKVTVPCNWSWHNGLIVYLYAYVQSWYIYVQLLLPWLKTVPSTGRFVDTVQRAHHSLRRWWHNTRCLAHSWHLLLLFDVDTGGILHFDAEVAHVHFESLKQVLNKYVYTYTYMCVSVCVRVC